MAAFRDKAYLSSSDDSASSDDESVTPWKRKRDHQPEKEGAFVNPLFGQKPKFKNNVWSSVLTDQTVTGDLCNFDIIEEKKSDTFVARDVESYRVTSEAVKKLYGEGKVLPKSSYDDLDVADDKDEMDSDEDDDQPTSVSGKKDDFMAQLEAYKKERVELASMPKDLRDKLGKRKHSDLRDRFHSKKHERLEKKNVGGMSVFTSSAKFQSDIPRANATDSAADVLKCILSTLEERNEELFTRILEKIGNEKALELLNRTEDIENAGGMMIKSGIRRRAPGGVFIQLVRSDPSLSADTVKELFPPVFDNKEQKRRKKATKRQRQKQHGTKLQQHPDEKKFMDVDDTKPTDVQSKPESVGHEGIVAMCPQGDEEDGEIMSD